MIIVSGKSGQLGNSLILYANFIAYATKHRAKLVNPSFYRYYSYFGFTEKKSSLLGKMSFYLLYYLTRMLHKINSNSVVYLDWNDSVNLDEEKNLLKGIKLVQGWNFRGNKTLSQHKNEIQQIFRPSDVYSERLNKFIQSKFNFPNSVKIGLHVRRGDYSWFEGGKYFYSIEDYNMIIERLRKIFPEKKIQVLICSNEKLELNQFQYTDITFGPGHELLDLYSFTYCDYLLGPPSTYTMWASFYGNVPLCMIYDKNKQFEITDFKVQETF